MNRLNEVRSTSMETVVDDSKLKEQSVKEDGGQSDVPICGSFKKMISSLHSVRDHKTAELEPEIIPETPKDTKSPKEKPKIKKEHPCAYDSNERLLIDNQFDSSEDGSQNSTSPGSRSPSLVASTEHEGDFFDDYMQFIIKPFEAPASPTLSSTISTSEISCVEPVLQRTIAIVKPEGMKYTDVILRAIIEAGFQIIGMRIVHFTPEQVSEIYAKHYGNINFPLLVLSASVEPVLALSLASLNAISKWQGIIGETGTIREDWFYPLSIRLRFGLHPAIEDGLHASENLEESDRENRYLFPESVIEPIIADEEKVTDYCNLYINPVLTKGLTKVIKYKPMDPVMFLAEWLLENNPFQPRMPRTIAFTPT